MMENTDKAVVICEEEIINNGYTVNNCWLYVEY